MKRSKTKIAVIIPAYNEESGIAEVVRAAKTSDLVDEVIVVSDGSDDNTVKNAKEAGASKVFALRKNIGKGLAMIYGVEHTKADIILFLDADVYGLTASHIKRLVQPVLRGDEVMNVGIRDRGRIISALGSYLPLIGGERALERYIIERIPKKYLRGFKIETAFNYYCRSRNLPYGCVFLKDVNIKKKMEKVGFFLGLWQYIKMTFEIINAMIAVRLARMRKIF